MDPRHASGVALAAASVRARLQEDRLARWSAIAAVPVVWLAVALADPSVLLLVPLAVGLLALVFRFGPPERYERTEELW